MRPAHPPRINPPPISIPNSPPSRKRKRSIRNPSSSSLSPWRTPKQQQIYSSNLLSSLRRLLHSPPTSLAVRSAADRALAATAGGRSRWSRAILRGVRIKARRPAVRTAAAAAVEAKARVLGRLVPGCRKLPLPLILDEVSDYIAALEVQVRAMSVLAGFLSGLGGGSPAVRS